MNNDQTKIIDAIATTIEAYESLGHTCFEEILMILFGCDEHSLKSCIEDFKKWGEDQA